MELTCLVGSLACVELDEPVELVEPVELIELVDLDSPEKSINAPTSFFSSINIAINYCK